MLSSVLAAITCAVIPVTDPLLIPAQTTPGAAPVEVGTYVTPTSFRCRNFSGVEQRLVFGAADHSVSPIVVVLPAGGTVQYEFSQQALAGVLLEVVTMRDGHVVSSGAHPIAVPATQPDLCLWTTFGHALPTTWQQLGCEVTRLTPVGTLIPDVGPDGAGGTEQASAPPCAVPVSPPRVPPPGTIVPYTSM